MVVRSSWQTNVYHVSLWVICVASRCVSYSQHLVVVVSENAGTALTWNSNGRCQRSVMVVQVCNQWVLRQCKWRLGWV